MLIVFCGRMPPIFQKKNYATILRVANLKIKVTTKLFIYSSKYDVNFVLSRALNKRGIKNLKGMALNTETFKTLSFNSYCMKDTMSFMPASLDKLVR